MLKKYLGAAALVAAASVGLANAASAEQREFSWSATIGGTSDYVFRGLSFTNEDPAFQASVNFSYGSIYWGVWGSNIDGAGFEPVEIDLYAGYTPEWMGFNFDFGFVYYTYPDANVGGSLGLDYVEFKAGVKRELVTNLTAGFTFWFTPDQDNYPETFTYEGTLAYQLPKVGIFTPTISGLVGYSDDSDETGVFAANGDGYTYWNAGIALGVENWTMDFRYWDTDLSQGPAEPFAGLSDERFVFSASVTIP